MGEGHSSLALGATGARFRRGWFRRDALGSDYINCRGVGLARASPRGAGLCDLILTHEPCLCHNGYGFLSYWSSLTGAGMPDRHDRTPGATAVSVRGDRFAHAHAGGRGARNGCRQDAPGVLDGPARGSPHLPGPTDGNVVDRYIMGRVAAHTGPAALDLERWWLLSHSRECRAVLWQNRLPRCRESAWRDKGRGISIAVPASLGWGRTSDAWHPHEYCLSHLPKLVRYACAGFDLRNQCSALSR